MRSILLLILLGCGPGSPGGPARTTMNGGLVVKSAVVSWDILAREPATNSATVRHVLVSWADLAKSDRPVDPRAGARSRADAERDIQMIREKAAAGIPMIELMRDYSEDPGSAANGREYDVTPDAGLVLEFKQLSLRLGVGERGICQSAFGFHLIERTK